MARVKVRRTNREELPGIAVLRDAVAAHLHSAIGSPKLLDLEIELDPDLQHLIHHDPDGFFTAIDGDETVGFAAAHLRSRQCVLSELWVLPQHHGRGAGEVLMRRIVAFGERSAAREFLALVPVEPAIQGLLLRHGFQPLVPVYLFQLPLDRAGPFGNVLMRLLPGQNVTQELLNRRGQADLDRIDRLTRNITREVDHVYWLKDRQFNAAVVRQGSRIAAYAYGGRDQAGPVAGSTAEAALSAMGWAIVLALKANQRSAIILRVPAPFVAAIDALQEAGAQVSGTEILYGRSLSLSFDRCLLGAANLP
jgi:GNAT superfamily N-acetyltransferase